MLLDILLAAIIVVAVAMVFVILLQRSEGGALGMSGGGPGNFMTARGAGDLLSRTTQVLAAVFFLLCLLMTILGGRQHAQSALLSRLNVGSINPNAAQQPQQPPASAAPAAQAQPASAQPAPARSAPAQPAPSNPLDLFGQGSSSAPKGQ
ncbi:MAG: preprotein translocase subunit SecG [Caulobacteraceae bacterium]|nr:preprotein translocase subunit SecG [Caulobacteraceae bacterium]